VTLTDAAGADAFWKSHDKEIPASSPVSDKTKDLGTFTFTSASD
jgi:hypothetical protein